MRTAQKGSRRRANIAEISRPSPVRANPRPPSRQSPRLGAAPANQIAAAQLVQPAHAYRVTSQSCLILHDRMSAFAVGCVRRQWHTGPQGAAQAVTPRRAADVDRTSWDDQPSVGGSPADHGSSTREASHGVRRVARNATTAVCPKLRLMRELLAEEAAARFRAMGRRRQRH